ncbi:MAG: 50S ribosomal protein L10 [Candidatus Marinimicrobia bacterium]|nr:50S ribosomal protein L10 [Candidatus Neomarinimicrobiota bacterium]MDD5581873.1 50S ribosomal protein L10 [Candidatus Neomarinimicrobiota bacterium]
MPNTEKMNIVQQVADEISSSKAVYFTDYLGLNVEQVNSLRAKMFKENIKMQVIKNTLIKIALQNAGYEVEKQDFLTGPTALVFGKDDPVAPAKVLTSFKKETKDLGKPEVKAILFEGKFLNAKKVDEIAELPDREVLLVKFLSGISWPLQQLLGTLQAPMRNLVGALNALKEKKQ